MNKGWGLLQVAAVSVLATLPASGAHRELSFRERVDAQAAIERVYYTHQTGTTRPFEEAVPRHVLMRKVDTYLRQSVLLERRWHTPVTPQMLHREWQRMAAESLMPERLAELHAALGDDAVVIQECLVRPIVVSRLVHGFYAADDVLHAAARKRAEDLRRALVDRTLDPAREHREREVVEVVREASLPRLPGADHRGVMVLELDAGAFEGWRSRLPRGVGEIPAVENSPEAFVVRVLLDERPDRITVASYVMRKRSWDDWWTEERSALDPRAAGTVADDTLPPPERASSPCDREPAWEPGPTGAVPDRRNWHSAVWTGTEMVVWGGMSHGELLRTALRYDPATDSWRSSSTSGAPTGRVGHSAVWTGDQMIVWGGGANSSYLQTGGVYDPASDTWTPMTSVDAPGGRAHHTAVWTGEAMIVWGGVSGQGYLNTGGRYAPSSDTWVPIPTSGAPAARSGATAVWTGERMVIWGGGGRNTGGRYDPSSDVWTPTSTVGSPSGRESHVAVWTGNVMVVWGGAAGGSLYTGGRYDPVLDVWTPTSTSGAPVARSGHSAVWTGSRVLVWGGSSDTTRLNSGGAYDPAMNAWRSTSVTGAPAGRDRPTAVWTGTAMLVWGGTDGVVEVNSGGRYDPRTDFWTPTSTNGVPEPRYGHTAVWTGNSMLIWGGWAGSYYPAQGARYDPATATWTPMSTVGLPVGRNEHTAVWTGQEMVIWGGTYLNTGGRYDPIADTWTLTSLGGAPSGHVGHTAIWTGNRMIVWGGIAGSYAVDTGGLYDPATDTWVPTSDVDPAAPRIQHTAVWTGAEMLVWGGTTSYTGQLLLDVGSRYDPQTNTWTPMSTANAPALRRFHSAVWTGNRMLIWGGANAVAFLNSAGLYDPQTDTWTVPSASAIEGRYDHTTVWAPPLMIVWGGSGGFGSIHPDAYLSVGGSYDTSADAWAPLATVGAPRPRRDHAAVWTGRHMLVWGGTDARPFDDGGIYDPALPEDLDGDGHPGCGVDCDDADPAVHPGASETCDGRDNQCAGDPGFGTVDEGCQLTHARVLADKDAGNLHVSWSTRSCSPAHDYVMLAGNLGEFTTVSQVVCGLGNSGAAIVALPGEALWWLVVPSNGVALGSFGMDSASTQRVLRGWEGACGPTAQSLFGGGCR